LMGYGKKDLVVLDVGSTKEQICRELLGHPNRMQFVASHPMAGNTGRGPYSASKNLFRDKVVYICDEHESNHRAVELVVKIWTLLGASVKFISSQEHDRMVAYVSHLPQLVSYAFANTASVSETHNETLLCASTGFDSVTRLAKSSAGMWIPIVNHNRSNLLAAISEMQHQLKLIETAIESNDETALEELFTRANRVRMKFETINQNKKSQPHEMQNF